MLQCRNVAMLDGPTTGTLCPSSVVHPPGRPPARPPASPRRFAESPIRRLTGSPSLGVEQRANRRASIVRHVSQGRHYDPYDPYGTIRYGTVRPSIPALSHRGQKQGQGQVKSLVRGRGRGARAKIGQIADSTGDLLGARAVTVARGAGSDVYTVTVCYGFGCGRVGVRKLMHTVWLLDLNAIACQRDPNLPALSRSRVLSLSRSRL